MYSLTRFTCATVFSLAQVIAHLQDMCRRSSLEIDIFAFHRRPRLNLSAQAAALLRTDILVGVEGAGLSWMVFQPPRSAVLELRLVKPHGNHLLSPFRNLARQLGHGWAYVRVFPVVNLGLLWRSVCAVVRQWQGLRNVTRPMVC